jgi:hypothetical protein
LPISSAAENGSWNAAIGVLHTLKRQGFRIVVFEERELFLWKDGEREFHDLRMKVLTEKDQFHKVLTAADKNEYF